MIEFASRDKRFTASTLAGRIALPFGEGSFDFGSPHRMTREGHGDIGLGCRLLAREGDPLLYVSEDDDIETTILPDHVAVVCDTVEEANLVLSTGMDAIVALAIASGEALDSLKALEGVTVAPTPPRQMENS
jgi:hypothetical protein